MSILFPILMAIMDWNTRAVLSWKLSNTLDTAFRLESLREAVATAGTVPEILNTDHGCQFTSNDWIGAVEGMGTQVSMDGRGRWLDNVFNERLWRSLNCERIYLSSYRNLIELEAPASPSRCTITTITASTRHPTTPSLGKSAGRTPALPKRPDKMITASQSLPNWESIHS